MTFRTRISMGVVALGTVAALVAPSLPASAAPVADPAPGVLTVTGQSASTAKVAVSFGPTSAGQYVRLQVSDNGRSWKTAQASTLGQAGTGAFTLSSLPSWARAYRAYTHFPGVKPATVSNETFFAPTPKAVSHALPVVRVDIESGKAITSKTKARGMNLSIDSGNPAKPTITAPGTYPTYSSPKAYTDTIKGRGNYSWTFPKKGFKIKLDKKADLLGMGKSKHWVLLANFYDHSLVRNSVASEISRRVFGDTAWIPQYRNVDLVMNGKYQGTYQLVEHVRVDEDRVAIDELDETVTKGTKAITGGYLMEWNSRKAPPYFTLPSGASLSLDSPAPDADDPDEVTYLKSKAFADQQAYIKAYVSACDKRIYASKSSSPLSYFQSCVDVDSVINWWIVNELMKGVNANLSHSAYMYKPRDGVLTMGTPWDFDLSAGDIDRRGEAKSPTGWFIRDRNEAQRMVKTTWINKMFENKAFARRAETRWRAVYPSIEGKDVAAIVKAESRQIAQSSDANAKVWPPKKQFHHAQILHGKTQASEAKYLQSWLSTRITWMNKKLG